MSAAEAVQAGHGNGIKHGCGNSRRRATGWGYVVKLRHLGCANKPIFLADSTPPSRLARGDAGRDLRWSPQEVKTLAGQTARPPSEISHNIV